MKEAAACGNETALAALLWCSSTRGTPAAGPSRPVAATTSGSDTGQPLLVGTSIRDS